MAEPTLKDYVVMAKKHLSEKPGSVVNLTLHGKRFTAKRNSDGTLTVCNMEHTATTPTDRQRVVTKIRK